MNTLTNCELSVFKTALGWLAMAGVEDTLMALSFGHRALESAQESLSRILPPDCRRRHWNRDLQARLQDYAQGAPVDFTEIAVYQTGESTFVQSVRAACRGIPYGQTLSYGELGALVGADRAGRAVGNVMRTNRCPLVIPCHRVVHADGKIGNFSAPQGATMKQRLLGMELASSGLLVATSGNSSGRLLAALA